MSIGSISSGLQSYLQGLSANTSVANLASAVGAAATSSTTGSTASTANSSAASTTSGTSSATHSHHHRTAMKLIQSAVSQALQQAQTTGTSEDPNKIVEDAIASVFKNGLTSPSETTASDTLAGQSADDPGTSNNLPDASTSTFLQALQNFGITPQQFQQDFTAAVKDAQNGSANINTALQSFPNGSNVDVMA